MGEQACKLKIILDGTNVSGLASSLCLTTRYLTANEIDRLTDPVAYEIIEKLNVAENVLIEAQQLLLENVIQYDGPLPKFLKKHGDKSY